MITDHKPLIGIWNRSTIAEDEKRLTRIRQILDTFDVNLQYLLGEKNIEADAMSRYGMFEEESKKIIGEEIEEIYTVEIMIECESKNLTEYERHRFFLNLFSSTNETYCPSRNKIRK